jgi:cyanate permease
LIGATIAIHFGQAAFSRVMGLTSPFTMGIGLFGPPMTGYIYDATGTYDLALNILTGMLVIAAVVTFFLKLTPAARR